MKIYCLKLCLRVDFSHHVSKYFLQYQYALVNAYYGKIWRTASINEELQGWRFHIPPFRTDPAKQSTSSDGCRNVEHIVTAFSRHPPSSWFIIPFDPGATAASPCFLGGSLMVTNIIIASRRPGKPLIIHAHLQPWTQHDEHEAES